MNITDLHNLHTGQTVCIVGKGPSLKHLSSKHFNEDHVIIWLNDSVRVATAMWLKNKTYSLQKDGDPRYMVRPDDNMVLLVQGASAGSRYSSGWFRDHPNRIILDPVTELGFQHVETTATVMAIAIAKLMGCSHIRMMCCDILTTEDARTIHTVSMEPELDTYKQAIYAYAKSDVLKDLQSISHDFVIPNGEKL